MRLREAIAEINATYGEGVVAQGSRGRTFSTIRFQTMIFDFDLCLGGGWPWGKFVQVYGPESGGKSVLMYKAMAGCQQYCRYCRALFDSVDEHGEELCSCPLECADCSAVFVKTSYTGPPAEEGDPFDWEVIHDEWACECLVNPKGTRSKKDRVPKITRMRSRTRQALFDAENSFDVKWARFLGIDPDYLFVFLPEYAEQGIDIADNLLRTNEIDFLGVDSIAELTPSKEVDSSVTGDSRLLVRYADGAVAYPTIEELYESAPFVGETMAFKDGRFLWSPVKAIWKPERNPKHRLLEVVTKYGRRLKLTSCHSVYRIEKENERRDTQRKITVCDGVPVLVQGEDLRVGDMLLLCEPEDKLAGPQKAFDLLVHQRSAESPYNRCHFAAEELLPSIKEDPRCKGRRYLYRKGAHGPHLPAEWLDRSQIADVSGKLYYTGASAAAQRFIPADRLAYLLGAYVGNGYMAKDVITVYAGVRWLQKIFERVRSDLEGLIEPGPNLKPRSGEETRDRIIRVGCKPLGMLFHDLFRDQHARTKTYPSCVWSWTAEAKRSVIEGHMDTDGHLSDGRATISTSSVRLSEDVVMLLASLGVTASVSIRQPSEGEINGKPVVARGPNYMVSFSWHAFTGNNEGRYGKRQPSVHVSDGLAVEIQSVREIPWEDVYDMEVVDSATFVANGILVHNSTEEWQMGLQARLVNKALRKWNSSLNALGADALVRPTICLINQERANIGGYEAVVPGGQGQKYKSSIRVRVNTSKPKFKEYGSGESKIRELQFMDISGFTKKNKCVTGDTVVFLPGESRVARVSDLVGKEDVVVSGWDGLRTKADPASCCIGQRIDEIIKLSASGLGVLRANAEHPVFVGDRFVRLGDIRVGDVLPVPYQLPVPHKGTKGSGALSADEARLLGLLTGDGWCGGTTGVSLTSPDAPIIEEFTRIAESFGCEVYPKDALHWVVRNKGGGHKGKPNKLYRFLKRHELWGKRSWNKVVPAEVFSASEAAQLAFLGGVIATDGHVAQGHRRVSISAASLLLAEGLRVLTSMLGMRASVRSRDRIGRSNTSANGNVVISRRLSYEVRISGFHAECLREKIHWLGGKEAAFATWTGRLIDPVIPATWALSMLDEAKARGIRAQDFAREINCNATGWEDLLRIRGKKASRIRAQALSSFVGGLSTAHVLELPLDFVTVESVCVDGEEMVYDICGTGTETFIAQGLIVHNTFPPLRRFSSRLYLTPFEGHPQGSTNEFNVIVQRGLDFETIGRPTKTSYTFKHGDYDFTWKSQKAIVTAMREDYNLFWAIRDLTMATGLKVTR